MKLEIHHFESLPSTQDSAKGYAIEGAQEGTIIIADEQTQGRGQMERSWYSPKGNLYTSMIIAPRSHKNAPAESSYGQIALLTGVAVRQGILALFPELQQLKLKWPNDGLIENKKLFGILVECFEDIVIVGIGVNVNTHHDDEQTNAASLKNICAVTQDIGVADLFHQILKSFFHYYRLWLSGEFSLIKATWEEHAHHLGEIVERRQNDTSPPVQGVFLGLNDDGSMRLRKADGQEQAFYSHT